MYISNWEFSLSQLLMPVNYPTGSKILPTPTNLCTTIDNVYILWNKTLHFNIQCLSPNHFYFLLKSILRQAVLLSKQTPSKHISVSSTQTPQWAVSLNVSWIAACWWPFSRSPLSHGSLLGHFHQILFVFLHFHLWINQSKVREGLFNCSMFHTLTSLRRCLALPFLVNH